MSYVSWAFGGWLKNPSGLSIRKCPPVAMSDIKIINPLRDTAIQHLVKCSSCIVSDNRHKGGILSVQLITPDDTVEKELLRLGFAPVAKEPHRYWIK